VNNIQLNATFSACPPHTAGLNLALSVERLSSKASSGETSSPVRGEDGTAGGATPGVASLSKARGIARLGKAGPERSDSFSGMERLFHSLTSS
jgi:hypothetical protein